MSRSRATVSLPCSCKMSGCSASTILASVASSASTVSATLIARPLACLPSSRAVSRLICRGDGGKNTKPDHVGAGLQRDVERLARGQAANFDDQGHGFSRHGFWAAATGLNQQLTGRVLQRRALLVSPTGPIERRPASVQEAAAVRPRGRRIGAQIGQLRPRLHGHRPRAGARHAASGAAGTRSPSRPPPRPMIATAMMTTNSGSVTATDGSVELNGSNDTVTRWRLATAKTMKIRPSGISTRAVRNFRMTISRVDGGRRACSADGCERCDRYAGNAYAPASGAPPSRFSRSRISLPVLKNGTLF